MAVPVIDASLPVATAPPTEDQLDRLRGTRSRALSRIARFYSSARSLGLLRVAAKLVQRAGKQLPQQYSDESTGTNLDALRRCSWVDQQPGISVVGSSVTAQDVLRFQNEMRYPHYYYFGDRRIRYSLWHFVGWRLAKLDSSSIVVDVGAQAGLWGQMIRRRVGCYVIDLDLEYKQGRHGFRIGAPASRIPLESQYVTHIVTFCAFNCFEGEDDTALLEEAARILAPGGQLIIVPLCIGDEYVNLFDPLMIGSVERLDPHARSAALPGWGNAFGRWYDRRAFEGRILRHAGAFSVEIHRITHPFLPHEGFAHMYAARLTRQS